jgi:hypothetical protein
MLGPPGEPGDGMILGIPSCPTAHFSGEFLARRATLRKTVVHSMPKGGHRSDFSALGRTYTFRRLRTLGDARIVAGLQLGVGSANVSAAPYRQRKDLVQADLDSEAKCQAGVPSREAARSSECGQSLPRAINALA